MGMMSLELERGAEINVYADGDDETQAIEEMDQFLLGA